MITTAFALSLLLARSEATLSIGDNAPKLVYGKEISGSPIHDFRSHRFAVVEFWATWCGPCIANMPHLSEMFKTYGKDVDFVGVSVHDDFGKVPAFVEENKAKIAYPMAIDDSKNTMWNTWLAAAGQGGLPCAFIIDKAGKIEWIGHPYYMEEPLKQIIAGTFNPVAYKKVLEMRVLNAAERRKFIEVAYGLLDSAAANGQEQAMLDLLAKEAPKYRGTAVPETIRYTHDIFAALLAKDYEKARALAKNPPDNTVIGTYYRPILLQVEIAALQRSGDKTEWRKLAMDVLNKGNDPNMLESLCCWLAMPQSTLPDADPQIAVDAAQKLVMKFGRSTFFLVDLAWAHYHAGFKAEARKDLDEADKASAYEKKHNPKFYPGLQKSLQEASKVIRG